MISTEGYCHSGLTKHEYQVLHLKMRKVIPRIEICPVCLLVPTIDIANIAGIYDENPDNWQWQCRSCHEKWHFKNGRIVSEEQKQKLSVIMTGKKHSEETRQKLSKSHLGKKFTEETKLKMSKAWIGRIFTKETKFKLSIAATGRKVDEDTKQKLRDSHFGLQSPMLGKKFNEEARLYMRLGWSARNVANERFMSGRFSTLNRIKNRLYKQKQAEQK